MEHHLCLLFKRNWMLNSTTSIFKMQRGMRLRCIGSGGTAACPLAQHRAGGIEALLELDKIVGVAFY